MATFTVTYEIVTEESAEDGEYAEQGYIIENTDLRTAIDELHMTRTCRVDGVECIECDEYPMREPRNVTVCNGMEYETGARESRTLHMSGHLSPATRCRIARLVGVR